MPSIGFGLGTPMGRLSAQDMGVPDYVKALSSGLSLGAKPAQLTEQLLGQTLLNKINTAKAQYAQRNEAAKLAHTQAGTESLNANTGLVPFHQRLLEAQARRQDQLANQPIMTPYDKALLGAQAKENVKTITGLEEEIPQAQEQLEKINRALEVSQEHPEWFGPPAWGLGKTGLSGLEARKRKITDPDFGFLESTINGLVGSKARELSGGNRVLASSLGLAGSIKPSLEENPQIALGKLQQIKQDIEASLHHHAKKYQSAGGRQNFARPNFTPRTDFMSKTDFHNYMMSLSPSQRREVNKILKNAKRGA